jgi:hypothetical protein
MSKGTKQFTAYENIVNVGNDKITTSNAMILPLPLKQGESIELIDLSKYPTFFADCENCFKETKKSNSRGMSKGVSNDYLEVKQIGGYKCSVAESLDDILKINPNVFVLPKDIHELLSNHYSKGFGFVVCLFNSDVLKTHPIAFTHSVIGENQLFVPTRHEHGNHSEKKKLVPSVAHFQHYLKGTTGDIDHGGDVVTTDYADWDHIIYSVNSKPLDGGDPENGSNSVENVLKMIPVSDIAPKDFRRLRINGTAENVDVLLNCN